MSWSIRSKSSKQLCFNWRYDIPLGCCAARQLRKCWRHILRVQKRNSTTARSARLWTAIAPLSGRSGWVDQPCRVLGETRLTYLYSVSHSAKSSLWPRMLWHFEPLKAISHRWNAWTETMAKSQHTWKWCTIRMFWGSCLYGKGLGTFLPSKEPTRRRSTYNFELFVQSAEQTTRFGGLPGAS